MISSVVTKRTTLARQSLVSSAITPQQKTTKTLVVAKKKQSIATIRNKKSRLESLSVSSKDESSSSSRSSDDEDGVGVPSKSSLSGLPTFRRESISTALSANKRKSRSPPPPPPSSSPPSTPPLRLPPRRQEGAPPVTAATESCVGGSQQNKAMPRKDDERQKDSMIPHSSSIVAAGRGGSTSSLMSQDELPRMSIFDHAKEEADDDDDDDASSLDTQNIPSYTKPLMVPARQKTSGAVGKTTAVPEVTSGFSFSKQNIVKTTTATISTPVSNKTTAVQNDSGRGGSAVAIPVPPTTASRPVTWNRAKSTLDRTKKALVMGNVCTKKHATSRLSDDSTSVQGMHLSAMATSCAAVGGESVLETNRSALPILSRANTSDDSNDEILKLAAKKTKSGGSKAPQINTTTLDKQLGLKEDDRRDPKYQSSWTPTANKLLSKARVRYYSSSSDDDHPVHQSKTSRKSMNISDFLSEQRALRKERATCHDNTDTLAVVEGVVVRDDLGLAVTEATKRDSAMLPVKHASSTKSPTVMDGVTRRYEDLIAPDSDDDSMHGTCKRLEKENSLDVVDGVRTTDSSRRDRPSRYFVDELPPTTDDTTPSVLKSRLISGESFAMRQSKHRGHGYRIQHVRSVLESATPLPRTYSAPNPNKTGSLSPFSSTDSSNSTHMKVGILKSGMRKRKFLPDSSSDDDVPILRSSKEKSNDITSSWSTDCEVDSPPMSPRHPRHRLASFRSNQVSKRTRCGEPSASPSTPVFDFIDEKPQRPRK